MLTSTYTAEFWQTLTRLRTSSRLILAALEDDDVEQVERLSRDAERDMASIRPIVDARVADSDRTEEDEQMAEMLRDLKDMNDRILEVLSVKSTETSTRIGEIRENKLKLVHYRSADRGPRVLDHRG